MTSLDTVTELAVRGDVPALIVQNGGDWGKTSPDPAGETGNGSPIEQARHQHAALLGEEPDRVRTVRLDLDVLLTLGTLVDVDVRGLSLFTAQSTWEDLGVTESDVRRNRFSRPMIYLLPKKVLGKFNTLGARARNNLANHSFDVMGFRPWRWVPFTAYRKWRKLHQKLTGEWDAARRTLILGEYDDLLAALERDLSVVAAETYATLAAGMDPSPLYAGCTNDNVPGLEAFTGRFTHRLMVRFPTRQAIEANLRLEYSTAALINPAMVEAELAARDRVQRAREAEWEAHRREQQLVWERADAERVRTPGPAKGRQPPDPNARTGRATAPDPVGGDAKGGIGPLPRATPGDGFPHASGVQPASRPDLRRRPGGGRLAAQARDAHRRIVPPGEEHVPDVSSPGRPR